MHSHPPFDFPFLQKIKPYGLTVQAYDTSVSISRAWASCSIYCILDAFADNVSLYERLRRPGSRVPVSRMKQTPQTIITGGGCTALKTAIWESLDEDVRATIERLRPELEAAYVHTDSYTLPMQQAISLEHGLYTELHNALLGLVNHVLRSLGQATRLTLQTGR